MTIYVANNACDPETYVFVHKSNHLTSRRGLYDTCVFEGVSGTVSSIEYQYRCTCSYGLCEYVFTKFVAPENCGGSGQYATIAEVEFSEL